MAGCSSGEISDWRDRIIQECPWFSYLDPRTTDITIASPEEIVNIDTDNIMKSDIVIFNVWKISPGTMGELALASFFGKECLIITMDKELINHPWIISAGIIYDSVDDIIQNLTIRAKRAGLVL